MADADDIDNARPIIHLVEHAVLSGSDAV